MENSEELRNLYRSPSIVNSGEGVYDGLGIRLGWRQKHLQFGWGNLLESGLLQDQEEDGWIILRKILETLVAAGGGWTAFRPERRASLLAEAT